MSARPPQALCWAELEQEWAMGVIVSLVPFRRSGQDADFMVYSITLRSKGAFDCGAPNAQIGKFGAHLQHSLPRCFRPLRVQRARVP